MSERICEAALPGVPDWPGLEWIAICDQSAVAVHRYACVHEHVVERATCADHTPDNCVGCRRCWELGHECPMDAYLIVAIT